MAARITEKEAANRLGIRIQTLRIWVKKKVVKEYRNSPTRSKRYDAEEIDNLKQTL